MISYSKWYEKLKAENDCLMELWGMKCNEKLFSDHVERLKIYQPEASGWVEIDETQRSKQLRETEAKEGFEHAYASYNRHVIVLCSSFVQQMLFEYVEVIIAQKPEKMHDYLNAENDKSRATVLLSEVLECESKEELLKSLGRRCATNVTAGSFSKVASRIRKMGGIEVPEEIVEIVRLRNRIVHEEKVVDVTLGVAQEAIYAAIRLLTEIYEDSRSKNA